MCICPTQRAENWGSKRVNKLLKTTQQVEMAEVGGTETQVFGPKSLPFPCARGTIRHFLLELHP